MQWLCQQKERAADGQLHQVHHGGGEKGLYNFIVDRSSAEFLSRVYVRSTKYFVEVLTVVSLVRVRKHAAAT